MKKKLGVLKILFLLLLVQWCVLAVSAATISFGETVTGTISVTGQTDSYTFDAEAGDMIYARMASNWSNIPQIQLNAPDGTTIVTSINANIYENSLLAKVDASGTYTLIARDGVTDGVSRQDTGTYGLFVQRTNNAGNADPIGLGQTKNSTISRRGEMKSYIFYAYSGDRIYSRLASSWYNTPQVQIFSPNGTRIATSTNENIYENSLFTSLDANGNYTVIVGDGVNGEDTGTFGLFVQRTNNAGTADPVSFGQTLNGVISKRGEMKSYVFYAYAGDRIYARMVSTWSNSPQIQLFAPNGTWVATSTNANIYDNSITITLESTGAYTLIVSDGVIGEDTGTYSLSLQFLGTQRTIANFSANTTFGVLPLGVQFTDASTNSPIAWSWDFGDGNTSTQKNASNIYASPGYYNVTLTATNSYSSNTTVKKNYIWVTARKTTKISIFRPSTGYWYFDNNLDGTYDNSFRFGGSTDQISKGDWNGDGNDGIALFRPSTGSWYFDNNLDGVYDKTFRYGNPTDRITIGDWDGDGKDGIALFRPSTGYWYFDYNLDGLVNNSFRFGGSTDQIVKGDWLGTDSDGIALFRNSTGNWYFDNNLDGMYDKTFRYGNPTDRIVVGDWDGDGNDGIALFRPSTGYWYFDYNLDGIVNKSFRYGNPTDRIVVGDWDGDGKDGIALFRPSTGYWYFDYNLDGVVDKSFRFGGSSDRIVVGKWV